MGPFGASSATRHGLTPARVAPMVVMVVSRLLGATGVAAGVPIDAVEDVETFDLSKEFDPRTHFRLQVKGDWNDL